MDFAFSSFDAWHASSTEREDLTALLAGMRGAERRTASDLGSEKVWFPRCLRGRALPCSKRAIFTILHAAGRNNRPQHGSGNGGGELGERESAATAAQVAELVGLVYSKGARPYIVLEAMRQLSDVERIVTGVDPAADGFLCERLGNLHWSSITRLGLARAGRGGGSSGRGGGGGGGGNSSGNGGRSRFMDDGEETYIDEPAEDVAAQIHAMAQYRVSSVFLVPLASITAVAVTNAATATTATTATAVVAAAAAPAAVTELTNNSATTTAATVAAATAAAEASATDDAEAAAAVLVTIAAAVPPRVLTAPARRIELPAIRGRDATRPVSQQRIFGVPGKRAILRPTKTSSRPSDEPHAAIERKQVAHPTRKPTPTATNDAEARRKAADARKMRGERNARGTSSKKPAAER